MIGPNFQYWLNHFSSCSSLSPPFYAAGQAAVAWVSVGQTCSKGVMHFWVYRPVLWLVRVRAWFALVHVDYAPVQPRVAVLESPPHPSGLFLAQKTQFQNIPSVVDSRFLWALALSHSKTIWNRQTCPLEPSKNCKWLGFRLRRLPWWDPSFVIVSSTLHRVVGRLNQTSTTGKSRGHTQRRHRRHRTGPYSHRAWFDLHTAQGQVTLGTRCLSPTGRN